MGVMSMPTRLGSAGWVAALLLLSKWWGQLQAKATNPDSVALLEDAADPLHSSQYSFVSATEHHSRHHPSPSRSAVQDEGLIEQRSGGLEGSECSSGSSSNRGVLPGLSKRRRVPPTAMLPLLGQCYSVPCFKHLLLLSHCLIPLLLYTPAVQCLLHHICCLETCLTTLKRAVNTAGCVLAPRCTGPSCYAVVLQFISFPHTALLSNVHAVNTTCPQSLLLLLYNEPGRLTNLTMEQPTHHVTT